MVGRAEDPRPIWGASLYKKTATSEEVAVLGKRGCLELLTPSFHQRPAHVGGGFGDGDSALGEDALLGLGGVVFASDDGSGVAHAASWRSGRSGNEGGDWLLAVVLDPTTSFDFGVATDFADQDDGFGLVVVVEHLDDVEVGGAVDGVATDADAGALAFADLAHLPDCFVSEGSGARDDADLAALVDVTGGDADAATAVGAFAIAGGDEAGAVGSDEAGLATLGHDGLDLHHVHDRDAFSDGDSEFELCIDGLQNRVGGEGWGHEDGTGSGSGLFRGFCNGIEDGHLFAVVFKELSAFARSDTRDELGAVVEAESRVTASEAAGDSLHEDLCVFVY